MMCWFKELQNDKTICSGGKYNEAIKDMVMLQIDAYFKDELKDIMDSL